MEALKLVSAHLLINTFINLVVAIFVTISVVGVAGV